MGDELRGRIAISGPRGIRRLRDVTIDGVEFRRTSVDALRLAGIRDGDVLTENDAHRMIDEAEPEAAMNRALRLLGHRDRSTAELAGRLSEDGFATSIVTSVTERLADYGYLDDVRFAADYVRSKRSAGWGRRRIANGLSEKGVDPELAVRSLDTHAPEDDEIERAWNAIRTLDISDHRSSDKALRRLVSRGFSYEVARAALERSRRDPHDLGSPRES
jgi:SOS response regulatory protein OraA/RecX